MGVQEGKDGRLGVLGSHEAGADETFSLWQSHDPHFRIVFQVILQLLH